MTQIFNFHVLVFSFTLIFITISSVYNEEILKVLKRQIVYGGTIGKITRSRNFTFTNNLQNSNVNLNRLALNPQNMWLRRPDSNNNSNKKLE